MARIRSIKPELLEDERTARLTHVEWRLFVSLLLLADDYGNLLRAAPERIHGAALWAHPREDLAKALEGLVVADLLVLYVVCGQRYAHIRGWDKHQKVDHPGKPLCPGVTEGSRETRETLAKVPETLAPDQDQDLSSSSPLPSRRSPSPPDQTPARSKPLAEAWGAQEWLRAFGAAWLGKYKQLSYGSPGDSKACGNLGDLLERLPAAERASAQAKAPEMFAEFFSRADRVTVERRHPFAFFVQEWGGLRVPKLQVAAPSSKPWIAAEKAEEQRKAAERAEGRIALERITQQLADGKAVAS